MILKSPLEIFWCVTNRCNLRCAFCLSESGSDIHENELSAQEREYVLREIIENKTLKVYITGGEPLVCAETLYYIEELKKNNIFVELTTNGTLLDHDTVSHLKAMGVNRVQVSLNGSSPSINDPLMGRGSFQRILKTIEMLLENNIETHVKITAVRQNMQDIPDTIRMLHRKGLEQIAVMELVLLGRGFHDREGMMPSVQELLQLRSAINALKERDGLSISLASHTLDRVEHGRPVFCTVGQETSHGCLITSTGSVIPCASAVVWEENNNIMDLGLRGAWNNLGLYQKYVDPDKLKGKCASCSIKTGCGGGCRALAYLDSKEIWGEYPLCSQIMHDGGVDHGQEQKECMEKA
jgi:radical SAM protein with 4Fe4S-binding SPASM domain